MHSTVRFDTSPSLSSLHAAVAMIRGWPLVAEDVVVALREPVLALKSQVASAGVDAELFWSHLLPLGTENLATRQLAERTLAKAAGARHRIARPGDIAGALSAVQTAYQSVLPGLDDELRLRRGPLESQFEARGPGLLAAMRRLVDEQFIATSPRVVLVYPVLGGGGAAHPLYNLVHFEAVLANPVAELPEIVRLGWMISQLQLDLPRYTEGLGRRGIEVVGSLATIPLVLAAAEEVELARLSRETIALALATWLPESHRDASRANLLFEWWSTYAETRPSLHAALVALYRLLDPSAL